MCLYVVENKTAAEFDVEEASDVFETELSIGSDYKTETHMSDV